MSINRCRHLCTSVHENSHCVQHNNDHMSLRMSTSLSSGSWKLGWNPSVDILFKERGNGPTILYNHIQYINCDLLDNLSQPIITHNHFPDVLTNDRCYERRSIHLMQSVWLSYLLTYHTPVWDSLFEYHLPDVFLYNGMSCDAKAIYSLNYILAQCGWLALPNLSATQLVADIPQLQQYKFCKSMPYENRYYFSDALMDEMHWKTISSLN